MLETLISTMVSNSFGTDLILGVVGVLLTFFDTRKFDIILGFTIRVLVMPIGFCKRHLFWDAEVQFLVGSGSVFSANEFGKTLFSTTIIMHK